MATYIDKRGVMRVAISSGWNPRHPLVGRHSMIKSELGLDMVASSDQAYEQFCAKVNGPVSRSNFKIAYKQELEIECAGGLLNETDADHAMRRLIGWYKDPDDHPAIDSFEALQNFVINYRQPFVWIRFLKMSHRQEFTLVAWLSSLLFKENQHGQP